MKKFLVWGIAFAALIGISVSAQNDPKQNPGEKITLRRLSSLEEPEFTEIDISSPTGIGRASFRAKDLLPGRKIVFKLHLAGLENFQLDTGRLVLRISVSSQDGSIRQHMATQNSPGEVAIDSSSPFWASVRKDPEKSCFEIIATPALTSFFRHQVKVSWIDFYR
jgi:hypothetical protein